MRLLLLALTALLGSATAFVASPLASTLHRSTAFIDQPLLAQKAQLQLQPQWPQRAGIISQSALVLPVVYSGCAATLAVRATHAATRGDVAVLVSLAALALIDLGPTAAAQLASAKRAVEANNGPDARSWRTAVRFKIVGQLGSLLFIAGTCRPGRVLLGATALLATSLCFWVLLGGARYRHDSAGTLAPIPEQVLRVLITTDGVLCVLAAVATMSPAGSRRVSLLSKCFSMGVIYGVLENVPGFVDSLPVLLGLKKPSSASKPPLGGESEDSKE